MAPVRARDLFTLEEVFALQLHQAGIIAWVTQHRFHHRRRWLFDFAWPERLLAVEVEGLRRDRRGRHQTFDGYSKDCDKYNAAVLAGWRLLRFTQRHIDAESAAPVVRQALES